MNPNQVWSEHPATAGIRSEYNIDDVSVGSSLVPFQRNANMPEYPYAKSSGPFRSPQASPVEQMWTAGMPDAINGGNISTTIGNGNRIQQAAGNGVNRNNISGNGNDVVQRASNRTKRPCVIL